MKFEAIDADEKVADSWTVYSVGGGALSDGEKIVGLDPDQEREIYSMNTITEILDWCEKTGKSYWEYVEECEGKDIWNYLQRVWDVMRAAVKKRPRQRRRAARSAWAAS